MNRSTELAGLALAAQLVFAGGALACEAHAKAAVETEAPAPKAKAKKDAVVEKCSCQSASDCTCKKGDCQCKKCQGHHGKKALLFESLREPVKPALPVKAELDASAGIFI